MNPHEEALRRIREAKEIDAEVLDLGDLGLEVLPEELSGLAGLRVLALGRRVRGLGDLEEWAWIFGSPGMALS